MGKRIDWRKSEDVNGNVWPNWLVEKRNRNYTRDVVETFNVIFGFPIPLYFDGTPYKGVPLPSTTKMYSIHNEQFMGTYTDLVKRRSMRDNCAFCAVSLALTQTDNYPAFTGDAGTRSIFKVAPDYNDPTVDAIYQLDLPMDLGYAIKLFDRDEMYHRLDEYDWSVPFRSKTPTYGTILRGGHNESDRGGWNHSPRLLCPASKDRKSIREVMKEVKRQQSKK